MLDQAQIDTQKLNLTYCHIISPVTGRVGLRQVDPGQLRADQRRQRHRRRDPAAADLGHLHAARGQSAGGAQSNGTRARRCRRPPIDRTGTTQLAVGKLDTIDNQIDTTTGTVKLRAIFDNPDESLFPNQFVNIKLLVNTLHNTVLVPTSAIQRGAPGTFVYLVKPNNTVAVQTVKLGPGDGQHVAVLNGLQPGAQVVDDGADRLKDGAKITDRPAGRLGRRKPVGPATRAAGPHAGQHRQPAGRRAPNQRMSPSRLFILRPVATSLLMAAIMLVGLFAYRFLPLSALPEVDYPTIQVQTFYPGASPDVMTSSVTAPLEVQFGQMPGLNQMSSISSAGASVITLQFSLDLSLDVAEQEVQAAINAAGNLLPSDLPAPPIYAKVNPADAPVLTLALTSKTLPLTQVEDLADTRLAQKISQLPGVGLVSLGGGNRPAVRVQANNLQLAAYGLNIDDLRTTLGNANVNTPKGNFDGPSRSYTINANDQIQKASEYNDLVIAYRNGAPVKLSDVAQAKEAPENTKLAAWMNTDPAIIVNIQRQPGANVIAVVDSIQALLPELQAALPAGVDVQVVTDRTTTIRASVADVEFELGLAVLLVVVVIFLFLRSPSATLIPSLSVPLSLVGTLAVMYLAGFSLNNLSLMALTIATGFVVDDAIVMIENISRYIEAGDPPLQAALQRLGADRLHDHLADGLADRGADPAVVHARRRRPAVPRVRDHPRGHDRHLGGGLADPGADDVRQDAAPSAARPRCRWSRARARNGSTG